MTTTEAPVGLRAGPATPIRPPLAPVALVPAAVSLVAHLAVAGRYGFFRDELYFIALSKRLAAGFVDIPPLTALLAWAVRHTLGESLVALHVLPALVNAALIVVAALIAREMGAGGSGQLLAAVGTAVAGTFMGASALFGPDAFDQLWWALAAFLVVRILQGGDPRLWLAVGAVCGVGLMTKLAMGFFGAALVAGLALTPARSHLRSRWLWAGGAVATLLASPYLVWQILNDFPTVEFWGNYGAKVEPRSPPGFALQQVLAMNPVTAVLWLPGLHFLLRRKEGQALRTLGWMWVVLFFAFMVAQMKFYFLAPMYTPLMAAGAVRAERWWRERSREAATAALALSAVFVAPLAMPVLPVETVLRLPEFLRGGSVQHERVDTPGLPQHFADRFGWPELADTVAGVAASLPSDERSRACVLARNYGQAGAIQFFAGDRVPPVIGLHNNYALWGPGDCTGEVLVVVGVERAALDELFAEVTVAAVHDCDYCLPREDDIPVYVARQPREAIADRWDEFTFLI